MLGRTYEGQDCSAARALELVGERWSLLIIRDAMFAGVTRFRDFQRRLGVASNTLKSRLDSFVASGLMERRRYSDSPELHEYLLTDKGLDLQGVIVALLRWGDRWAAPDGPPAIYEHKTCGGRVDQQIHCMACGETLSPGEVQTRRAGTTAERHAELSSPVS
jgi:DNA-binding HxlR family transcriptional regulator